MTLRPVVSALFVVLLAMMAASENVWGAAAASTVARASIVQVSATEDAVMRVRSIKEIKFQRAFQRTTHQQYDFSCGSAALFSPHICSSACYAARRAVFAPPKRLPPRWRKPAFASPMTSMG